MSGVSCAYSWGGGGLQISGYVCGGGGGQSFSDFFATSGTPDGKSVILKLAKECMIGSGRAFRSLYAPRLYHDFQRWSG